MADTKISDLPDGGSIQPSDEFVIARGPNDNFKILGSAIGGGGGLPAGANIYYVSANGNDSNDGSSLASPKLTFGAALSAASPYDAIVCLEGGSFSESVTISQPVLFYAPNITLTSNDTATMTITAMCRVSIGILENPTNAALEINTPDGAIIIASVIQGNAHSILVNGPTATSHIGARACGGDQEYNSTDCNVTINENLSGTIYNSSNLVGQIGDELYGFNTGGGLPNYSFQWFVSAEIGNDANSGLNESQPFATIGAAVSAWQAASVSGQITILDSQTYNENVVLPSTIFVPTLYGPTAAINGSLTVDTTAVVRLGSVTNPAGPAVTISTPGQIDLFIRNLSSPSGYAIDCTAPGGGGVIYSHRSTDNFNFNDGSYFVGIGKVDAPNVTGSTGLVGYVGPDLYAWNSGSGGANQANIIYVGKHGDDINSGLNISEAKLTFNGAYTAATTGDSIVCLDGGQYDEYLTVAKEITIFAPNATLHSSSVGANYALNLASICYINFQEISHQTLIGLTLQTADQYIVQARRILGGGSNQSILSTTSVGVGTIIANEIHGDFDCNNSSYSVEIDQQLTGSVVDGGNIIGRVGNTFYNMNGVSLPYAMVGPSSEYTTVKDAVDAGHTFIYVTGNTLETANITLPAATTHIYCVDSAIVGLNSYHFICSGPATNLILDGGGYDYAYNSVTPMVNANGHPTCQLFLRNVLIANNSVVSNCSVNDAAMTISAKNVTFYLPAIDGGGINGTRCDQLSDIHLVGQGASTYNGIFNLNDATINNILLTGTWSETSPAIHCAEPCAISNVIATNDGQTKITLLVIGSLNNVHTKNDTIAIDVLCGADSCSLYSLKLNGGSVDPQAFGDHSMIDVTASTIESSVSNTDNMTVSNCNFSQPVTLQANGCQFSNCTFALGFTIFQNCNYNGLVNCIAGDISSPGTTTSFTINTGCNGTTIVGCKTDSALVDSGTGTQTAANVVY